MSVTHELGDEHPAIHALAGRSPAMQQVRSLLAKAASSKLRVALRGETGTGKELMARAVHACRRPTGPFVALNCAEIPESLAEAMLFGYVRGAFTGADQTTPGLLDAAHGGTLFLDEIGDLPRVLQPKLLRVLEDGGYRPVGSTVMKRFDGDVVTATLHDMEELVRLDAFRRDLHQRLSGVRIVLPPLREHVALDFEDLVESFVLRGSGLVQYEPCARELLVALPWLGNVREFLQFHELLYVLYADVPVTAEMILAAMAIAGNDGRPRVSQRHAPAPRVVIFPEQVRAAASDASAESALEAMERALVTTAVEMSGGHQGRAAALLRTTSSRVSRILARARSGR